MADVEFNEEEVLIDQTRRGNLSDTRSGLVKLVMSLKLAKTEAQANYVLIIVMLFAFLATIFIISRYVL